MDWAASSLKVSRESSFEYLLRCEGSLSKNSFDVAEEVFDRVGFRGIGSVEKDDLSSTPHAVLDENGVVQCGVVHKEDNSLVVADLLPDFEESLHEKLFNDGGID